LFSNMFVTCQQMAVASASWPLALIIATAIIIHIMEGQGWIGSCGPQGWCSIAQRAAWRADGANLTSGAPELLWPSETNVYIILSPHSTEFNPVRAGAQACSAARFRQAGSWSASHGRPYDAGFPRRRRAVRHQETAGAHGMERVCGVGWGNGTRKRTRTAPHRMFCFGRTYVRRRATGAAANAYASRLGHLNSSYAHGPRARAPAAGQRHCRLPCVGAGFWIRTCECDGCGGEEVDVARCTLLEWRLRL